MVVCCAMLGACDDGVAPRDPDVTLDMLLADFNDVRALRNQLVDGLPPYLVANDSMPAADACPYDASTRRFVCQGTISNGLTLTRSFQLLDASGLPQSEFSPTETRAIRAIADLNGTIAEFSMPSASRVSSHWEQTLSGLPSGTHTLSGVRSTTVDVSLYYPTDTVTSSATMVETTGLAIPKRGMGSPYPQSGTLMSKLEQSTPGHDASVTVTFNGTSVVTRTPARMAGRRRAPSICCTRVCDPCASCRDDHILMPVIAL
jgi:hypothetical protein